MFDLMVTDNLQYQSHFIDTENITGREQRKKAHIVENKGKRPI
jgi:hypothetical protein